MVFFVIGGKNNGKKMDKANSSRIHKQSERKRIDLLERKRLFKTPQDNVFDNLKGE